MAKRLKVNGLVELLDHPRKNDPNHVAMIIKIFPNKDIIVSNMNMPFMGTYSGFNGLIKKGRYKTI
jgi:hypothetical protein